MKRLTLILPAIAATFLLFTASSQGAVLLSFTNGASTTGAFNTLQGSDATSRLLNDTTNAASGFSVIRTGSVSGNNDVNTFAQGATGDVADAGFTLASGQSVHFTNGFDLATYTFSGLDPASTYDFTIWGSRNANDTRVTRYTLGNGVTSTTDTLQVAGPVNNANVVVLGGIAPTAGGELSLSLVQVSGGFGYINALRIDTVAVPEPSMWALLGLGIVGIVAIRRRRRQA